MSAAGLRSADLLPPGQVKKALPAYSSPLFDATLGRASSTEASLTGSMSPLDLLDNETVYSFV